MRVTQPEHEEGNAKEEGRERPPTHLAHTGQPWQGKGKEKQADDGQGPRPEGGGWRRLNQPTMAKPTLTSARTGPNLT